MNFVRYGNVTRMAAFPFALGLIGVLVSGTLNRVMIVELAIPAALVGLLLAVPPLFSPLRMWLGYRSDAYPLFGLRREPYIIAGGVIAGVGVLAASALALDTAAGSALAVAGLLLAFLAYGVGKHLASNTFEALLADKFEGHARSRAVTLFKIPMFVGIIGGAIFLGRMLEPFSTERLLSVVVIVAGVMAVFALLAVVRQEPRSTVHQAASVQARRVPFLRVVKQVVWDDPQARRFFIFVMLTIVGTQAQDVLLEPYGALVLGMSVSETTRLTSLWGTGTILAMALAGAWLIKRFGYRRLLQAGLLTNISVFGGIIAAGLLESAGLFQGIVFVLGVGTGLAAAGAFSAVVDFTTVVRAGFLMGVWGTASELGEAVGNLFGGAIVDIIRGVTGGNALAAYGTVFVLEGLLLVAALFLLARIDIRQSAALNESVDVDASGQRPEHTPLNLPRRQGSLVAGGKRP